MARTLNSVVVTTDDFAGALRFYVDGLRLAPSSEQWLDPDPMARLWGLERSLPIRSVLLKRRPEDDYGYIRLVEITGAGGLNIRAGAEPWDHGLFDIAFMVTDNDGKFRDLEQRGHSAFCWPTRYELGIINGLPFYIKEGVMNGPNDAKIVFIERFNAPDAFGRLDANGFGEIADVVIMTDDLERSMSFFREVAGLPERAVHRGMSGPAFARILGCAPDDSFTLALMGEKSPQVSCVNFIAFDGPRGKPLTQMGNMLNYGAAALSIRVDDVNAAYGRARDRDVPVVCPPVLADFDGLGQRLVFTCRGPHSVLCEMYEA